jgi:alkanesulfonate monooxygenase SsuD/methylene tetrahydromethanopterin reductase-like flavin-dependent oxidoreductase (luciferase family)
VAGIPVAVVSDVDKAKERAATLFAGYNGIPAYQRIRGEGGDSALPDIAIIGDEKTVEARLRGYAEAGATDVAAAVIGLDDDREGSMHRTMQLLADVAPALGAVS